MSRVLYKKRHEIKKEWLANNWDQSIWSVGWNTRFKIDCNLANKRVVNSQAHALRLWMDFDCVCFRLSYLLLFTLASITLWCKYRWSMPCLQSNIIIINCRRSVFSFSVFATRRFGWMYCTIRWKNIFKSNRISINIQNKFYRFYRKCQRKERLYESQLKVKRKWMT